MAQKLGKLLTCDRCGITLFLEKKMDKTDYSDGYVSDLSEFEDAPDDWTRLRRANEKDDVLLCSDCSRLFDKICNDFMDSGRVTHARERTDILL